MTMREVGEGLRDTNIDRGIGVDAQLISEIEVAVTNPDFLSRNFTNAEIAFCRAVSRERVREKRQKQRKRESQRDNKRERKREIGIQGEEKARNEKKQER